MVNYQNGKIYKIVNDINVKIYVGSTCNPLSKRMGQHRSVANNFITSGNGTEIQRHMYDLGIGHFEIILLESFPCLNRDELNKRERYYVEQLKSELNNNRIFFCPIARFA